MKLDRIARGALSKDTVELAKELIGCFLVSQSAEGQTAGRIVEVEAYLVDDPASHAYRGRTPRNAAMFLRAHHAYVYRIYGTSYCVNVTSEAAGTGAAVLVRALEPTIGLELMAERRGVSSPRDLCRGPGRLCRALGIDGSLDGVDLIEGPALWLARHGRGNGRVGTSTRIGVTRAADRPLRFYELGNAYVSGPKRLSPSAP